MKQFSEIFSISLQEYRANWKLFFLILLVFSFIPGIIIALMALNFQYELSGIDVDNINQQSFFEVWNIITGSLYFFPLIILGIFSILLYILMSSILISFSLSKKKLTFGEATTRGLENLFRYFIYHIVLIIFLIPLYIVFIIPGIIFSVYWTFSAFILIGERKSIIESLRTSFNLIKNRWWRTLGVLLLMLLIIILISMGVGIINTTIDFLITLPAMIGHFSDISTLEIPYYYSLAVTIVDSIFSYILNALIIPFSILFIKNLYLDYKGVKVKK